MIKMKKLCAVALSSVMVIGAGVMTACDGTPHTQHTYVYTDLDETNHKKTCSGCSEVDETEAHVYTDANDQTCNLCGHERTVEGHTHTYVYEDVDGTNHKKTCSGCTEVNVNEAHVYTDENDATCNLCGHERTLGGAHNHTYEYEDLDETNHKKTCSGCTEVNVNEAHVYTDEADTTCNLCGHVRTVVVPETLADKVVKATAAQQINAMQVNVNNVITETEEMYLCDDKFELLPGTEKQTQTDVQNGTMSGKIDFSDFSADMVITNTYTDQNDVTKTDYDYEFLRAMESFSYVSDTAVTDFSGVNLSYDGNMMGDGVWAQILIGLLGYQDYADMMKKSTAAEMGALVSLAQKFGAVEEGTNKLTVDAVKLAENAYKQIISVINGLTDQTKVSDLLASEPVKAVFESLFAGVDVKGIFDRAMALLEQTSSSSPEQVPAEMIAAIKAFAPAADDTVYTYIVKLAGNAQFSQLIGGLINMPALGAVALGDLSVSGVIKMLPGMEQATLEEVKAMITGFLEETVYAENGKFSVSLMTGGGTGNGGTGGGTGGVTYVSYTTYVINEAKVVLNLTEDYKISSASYDINVDVVMDMQATMPGETANSYIRQTDTMNFDIGGGTEVKESVELIDLSNVNAEVTTRTMDGEYTSWDDSFKVTVKGGAVTAVTVTVDGVDYPLDLTTAVDKPKEFQVTKQGKPVTYTFSYSIISNIAGKRTLEADLDCGGYGGFDFSTPLDKDGEYVSYKQSGVKATVENEQLKSMTAYYEFKEYAIDLSKATTVQYDGQEYSAVDFTADGKKMRVMYIFEGMEASQDGMKLKDGMFEAKLLKDQGNYWRCVDESPAATQAGTFKNWGDHDISVELINGEITAITAYIDGGMKELDLATATYDGEFSIIEFTAKNKGVEEKFRVKYRSRGDYFSAILEIYNGTMWREITYCVDSSDEHENLNGTFASWGAQIEFTVVTGELEGQIVLNFTDIKINGKTIDLTTATTVEEGKAVEFEEAGVRYRVIWSEPSAVARVKVDIWVGDDYYSIEQFFGRSREKVEIFKVSEILAQNAQPEQNA